MAPLVTVVGGANTDIVGFPEGRYRPADSNPGHVRVAAGGVGRNIAENLVRLGVAVRLVTAFGADSDGRSLRERCEELGIDTRFSFSAADLPGSRYLAVLDDAGDLAAAVSDMRALEALDPGAIDEAAVAGADLVVLDTNVSAAVLERVVALAGAVAVVLDPVSVAKARRARPVLGRVRALKANAFEAEELAGTRGIERAVASLLAAGVGWVFVTQGPRGVLAATCDEQLRLPAPQVAVANATGAGDAFTAGVAYGIVNRWAFAETAAFASALAALTLASERSVSDAVSLEAVRAHMEKEQR